jgi:contact-dependent growth inhibition (CDI) system CdiI-like immunity protein
MTPKNRRRGRRPMLSANDVPALAGFARAYLHQDVLIEHGSAAEAVRAFCRDSTGPEQAALTSDFARLIAAAADWPPAVLARWFRENLGAAWSPDSFDDVAELGAVAARGHRGKT